MRGGGGFLLLLIGAVGLIGYLTGNLPRWLDYLFGAGGSTAAVGAGTVPTGPGTPIGPNPDREPRGTTAGGTVASANQRSA